MTPLVAMLVVVLVGVIAVNLVGRARAGVRSVRSHNRALDTLGHITAKPLAARDRAPDAAATVHQAHVRILWPEPEVPPPDPAVLAEQRRAASVAAAAPFRLPEPPAHEEWDVVAVARPEAHHNGSSNGASPDPDHDESVLTGPPTNGGTAAPGDILAPSDDNWPDQILPKDDWTGEIRVDDWPSEILRHDSLAGRTADDGTHDELDLAPTGSNLGLAGDVRASMLAADNLEPKAPDSRRTWRSLWRQAAGRIAQSRIGLGRPLADNRGPLPGGEPLSDDDGGGDNSPVSGAADDEQLEPAALDSTALEPTALEPSVPESSVPESSVPESDVPEPGDAEPDGGPNEVGVPMAPTGSVAAATVVIPGPSPSFAGPPGPARHLSHRRLSHRRRPSRRVAAAALTAPVLVIASVAVAGALGHQPHHAPVATVITHHAAAPPTTVTTAPPTTAGIPVKLIANSPGTSLYQLAGAAPITVTASGLCWVEIRRTDANGPLVWYATMTAGATESVSGPVWVRLGNPTAVAVSVGGAALSPPLISGEPYTLQFE